MNIYYYVNEVFSELEQRKKFRKQLSETSKKEVKKEIKRLIEFENRFGSSLSGAAVEVREGILEGKYRQDYWKKEIEDYEKNGLPYLDSSMCI